MLPDTLQNQSEWLNLANKPSENTWMYWARPPEPKATHVAMASHFAQYPTRETVAQKAVDKVLPMVVLIPAGSRPEHSMEQNEEGSTRLPVQVGGLKKRATISKTWSVEPLSPAGITPVVFLDWRPQPPRLRWFCIPRILDPNPGIANSMDDGGRNASSA